MHGNLFKQLLVLLLASLLSIGIMWITLKVDPFYQKAVFTMLLLQLVIVTAWLAHWATRNNCK